MPQDPLRARLLVNPLLWVQLDLMAGSMAGQSPPVVVLLNLLLELQGVQRRSWEVWKRLHGVQKSLQGVRKVLQGVI